MLSKTNFMSWSIFKKYSLFKANFSHLLWINYYLQNVAVFWSFVRAKSPRCEWIRLPPDVPTLENEWQIWVCYSNLQIPHVKERAQIYSISKNAPNTDWGANSAKFASRKRCVRNVRNMNMQNNLESTVIVLNLAPYLLKRTDSSKWKLEYKPVIMKRSLIFLAVSYWCIVWGPSGNTRKQGKKHSFHGPHRVIWD